MPASESTYDLPHGVRLTVSGTSGKLTIRGVADGLAEAMRHFMRHRDELKTGLYTLGDFSYTARRGRKTLGVMRLSCGGDAQLTAGQWLEAINKGYADATTIEDMLGQLPAFREVAASEGGWVLEVATLLQRGDHLEALRVLMGRKRAS